MRADLVAPPIWLYECNDKAVQVENSCADMGIFAMQMDGLMAGMGPKESQTKTRGVRRTEAARAVGEGIRHFNCLSYSTLAFATFAPARG